MSDSGNTTAVVTVPTVTASRHLVRVIATATPGPATTTISGLPHEYAQTTRDRLRAALVNTDGLAWPQQTLTLRVVPDAAPTGDSGLDLAFAVAVLTVTGQIPTGRYAVFLGELGLDGALRPLPDVAAPIAVADRAGVPVVVVPAANLTTAALSAHAAVSAASSLAGLVAGLRGHTRLLRPQAWPTAPAPADVDLADLPATHAQARRLLEVAAAGGHHLLLVGPSTHGARMLAQRLPGLLPDLDPDSAAQVAAAHRQAGTLAPQAPVRRRPPWQAPHHTLSIPALAGTPRRPGAVALAHAGVLFCEDADQFSAHARDVLRLVCDRRVITAAGGGASTSYPTRTQLVLSATGCPWPTPGQGCTRAAGTHRHPLRHMSVLLDRVDIHAILPPMPPPTATAGESTAAVADRVRAARAAAAARWARHPWTTNREATAGALGDVLAAQPPTWWVPLRQLIAAGTLSARAGLHVLRLAWSVADLAGHRAPTADDLDEALTLRGVITTGSGRS